MRVTGADVSPRDIWKSENFSDENIKKDPRREGVSIVVECYKAVLNQTKQALWLLLIQLTPQMRQGL